MYRIRAWGLAAAVSVCAATSASAVDPPTNTTLFGKLFGDSSSKSSSSSTKPNAATPNRPPTVTAPLTPEVLNAALHAEQDAYSRRLVVCTKLRLVAAEKNDEVLARQVDDLEQQAKSLYNQRVEALGVPKVKVPLPSPSARIDRELGTGVAVNPLTAPAALQPSDSATRTAARSDLSREVKP